MEVDIAEGSVGPAKLDIVDYSDTAEDIVAADFRNSIDSCQHFVHIQNYWDFDDGSLIHHPGSLHHLDL